MLEKLKILKEVAVKVYPYFAPSYNNCARTAGFIAAIIVVPVINFIVPKLFFAKDSNSESNSNDFNIITALATASSVALLSGVQKGLSTMLATSAMQAMKERNTQLLMDKSKFLMHGSNKDISSLQYVTVGVGVRDFTHDAIATAISLPMYTITSISTITNIGIATESFKTSIIVLALAAASVVGMYISGKWYFLYGVTNQKIENDLVGKVAFIEAHRGAITLMGASDAECKSIIQNLQKVDATIPKLSLLIFSNTLITSISTAIASQFFGGYYKDGAIQDINNSDAKVLNLLLISLIMNAQSMVWILTSNYEFVKLNLEQLNAFDKAYNDCLHTRNTNNKMKLEFVGDHLSLLEFCVYKPDPEDTETIAVVPMFNKVTLELLPNKIYKLTGDSGAGKTTFLKAITNNWQYTEGVVKFPANAKEAICFIPQNSFIPLGTLLEVLTYPLKPQEFLATYPVLAINNEVNLYEQKEIDKKKKYQMDSYHYELVPQSSPQEEKTSGMAHGSMPELINKVKYLLAALKLFPSIIREDEIERENINWGDRLSGGEKQKIGIIRALLSNPKFIIMDEATAALDKANKQIVYEVVKNHITQLENYTIIYTEHDVITNFTDIVLAISGQTLESHEFIEF